jgi:prepilin-type processing-associated H-X9-DG protein
MFGDPIAPPPIMFKESQKIRASQHPQNPSPRPPAAFPARHYLGPDPGGGWSWSYLNESQIERPALTPVVADGVDAVLALEEANLPPLNIYAGIDPDYATVLGYFPVAIPRHGTRPNPVPTYWPRSQPLPGAINVTFYDGHSELVKLDNLWQLYWHRGWQPPAKRPGL